MKRPMLTGHQVLARMRRGDLPHYSGSGGDSAVFDDGARARFGVMRQLRVTGQVDPPAHTSVHSPWTIPEGDH